MEGKVEHKFDMKPHEKNMEEYGRLCRERTNKSMIKNRQIQVVHSCAIHLRQQLFFPLLFPFSIVMEQFPFLLYCFLTGY